MLRLSTSLAVLFACTTAPALAADWADDWGDQGVFRGGYSNEPKDWSGLGDEYDSIHIETGLRYWYSWGQRQVSSAGVTTSSTDNAHTGEAFMRVEDDASATFGQAMVGYSVAIHGDADGTEITDGTIGYAGADFGWKAFSDGQGNGIGGLIGYLYWNDSPDTGRTNFTTATSSSEIGYDPVTGQTFVPGDSAPNHIDIHALRLGIEAKANLGDLVDIRAEVAAVPYAHVGGVVSADDPSFDTSVYGDPAQFPYDGVADGNISGMRSSETAIDGWGYGAMAEAWVGVHPVENLTFRVGGRAWYLQGTADATYTRALIGNPTDTDGDSVYDGAPTFENVGVIQTNNPFSLFRYGLLAELTYAF